MIDIIDIIEIGVIVMIFLYIILMLYQSPYLYTSNNQDENGELKP